MSDSSTSDSSIDTGANVLGYGDVDMAPEDIHCVSNILGFIELAAKKPREKIYYILIDPELSAEMYKDIKNLIYADQTMKILNPRPYPYLPVIRVRGVKSLADLERIRSQPGQTVLVHIAVGRLTYNEYHVIASHAGILGYIVLDHYPRMNPRMNLRRALAGCLLGIRRPWDALLSLFMVGGQKVAL